MTKHCKRLWVRVASCRPAQIQTRTQEGTRHTLPTPTLDQLERRLK